MTIRTLDPPLHEFLPHEEKDIQKLATRWGLPIEQLTSKVNALHEANPDARPSRMPPWGRLSGNHGHAGPGHHGSGLRSDQGRN